MKSYTDIEQSKVLAKIFPLKSADAIYIKTFFGRTLGDEPMYHFEIDFRSPEQVIWDSNKAIPCWSLAALRNLLPTAIKLNKDTYLFESHNTFDNSWVYRYYNEDDVSYLYYKNTNEVDACYEMIIKLNELKIL